jgi:hypothetical protein
MDHPEETYSENFLKLMLKYRPKYAVVWDIDHVKLHEFRSRVYVVEYFVVRNGILYFSNLKPFAKKIAKDLQIERIEELDFDTPEKIENALPIDPKNKRFKFWAPNITEEITNIDLNEFLPLMLKIRPPYCVLWDVEFKDIDFMASKVYVVSYMPVINNIIYYSYAKHFAVKIMKKFNIPEKEAYELGTYVPD